MSFKGKSCHLINKNGRISLPSRIRDELKSTYNEDRMVLVCLSDFIVAFPTKEWERYESNLHSSPILSSRDSNRLRRLYESLEDVVIDANGRILISAHNRELAGLKGECVILGLYDRVEIWSKDRWDTKVASEDDGGSNEQLNLLIF